MKLAGGPRQSSGRGDFVLPAARFLFELRNNRPAAVRPSAAAVP